PSASERNATNWPLAETAGAELSKSPWPPSESTLTRVVVPLATSCRKTSRTKFVAAATGVAASLAKARGEASALMRPGSLARAPSVPDESLLTIAMVLAATSHRKTSEAPFRSLKTRSLAKLEKTTRLPSPEIDGDEHGLFGSAPFTSTEMRVVVAAA